MKRLARTVFLSLVRRFGWPGVGGGIALVAGLALALSLPALQRETSNSVASMAARGLAARQHMQAGSLAGSATPASAARAYVDAFPAMRQNAADIAQVFAAAQLRHVQLPRGEYQLKAEPGAAFVSYTATFPVRGDFDAVKGFSADVLNALPHVSMDELRLSRDNPGSTTLDAVVRFTFFYRSA